MSVLPPGSIPDNWQLCDFPMWHPDDRNEQVGARTRWTEEVREHAGTAAH